MAELTSSEVLAKANQQYLYKPTVFEFEWGKGSGGVGGSGTTEVWLGMDDKHQRLFKKLKEANYISISIMPDITKTDKFQSNMVSWGDYDITVYFTKSNGSSLKLTIRSYYSTLNPNSWVAYDTVTDQKARLWITAC